MPVAVPEELSKYVDPSVPAGQRLVAARGLVPLAPDKLALVYYFLAQAPEAPVVRAAEASLAELPPNLLRGALAKVREPEILDFYAKHRTDDEALESIIANPATSAQTLTDLARTSGRYIQSSLIHNQRRLMEDPAISEALLANPDLAGDLKAQVVEFRQTFLEIAPELDKPAAPESVDAQSSLESMELIEADDIGLAAADEIEDEDDFPDELLDEVAEGGEDGLDGKTLQAMISQMTISQKIRLATLGNKAARGYLIRDSNRLVATAVLRSPRLREDEVEEISKDRNVDESVLRLVAQNKNWSKSYSIKKNLTENPKAPQDLSVRLVTSLNEKDQGKLSKNKNVPTAVRNAARRLIMTREETKRRKAEKK